MVEEIQNLNLIHYQIHLIQEEQIYLINYKECQKNNLDLYKVDLYKVDAKEKINKFYYQKKNKIYGQLK